MVVAGFVLDRNDCTVLVDLDDVADAGQAELVVPDGKRPQYPDPVAHFASRLVHVLMEKRAPHGSHIILEAVLKQDQPSLPRAVVVVF